MRFLLFLLMISSAVLARDCEKFELQGNVKVLNGEYVLIVHEGTRLERKFFFQQHDLPKLAPYAGKSLKGEFILPSGDPVSGTKVLSVIKIDFAVPDPLQVERGMVKLGPENCPKTP
ncbi:MAG: hypothetical protein ACJ76H_13095 [Bacteriovoracaceae bacterium]